MRRLLAVLLVLAVLTLLLLTWERRRDERGASGGAAAEERSAATGLAEVRAPDGGPVERPAARESPTEEAARAERSARASPGRSIHLCVLRSLDRSPLAEVQVSLAVSEREAEPGALSGTTDAEGGVRLDLSASDWALGELAQARVLRSEPSRDECELFEGSVRLQEEMVVLGCDCTELCGRIVGTVRAAMVSAFEPQRGAMNCPVFLGRASVTAENSFAIPVCPRRGTPEVELRIDFDSGSCLRVVPWSELVSAPGASIRIETGGLRVHVLDEPGRPLAGATVCIAPLPRGAPLPAVLETKGDGEASATLPAGPFAVCAGKPGYAAEIQWGALEPGTEGELELRLRALTRADVVEGRVLFADGSAVANAFVTAEPVAGDDELTQSGAVQVTADEQGRFRIPIGCERELRLVASARGHGLSEEIVLAPDGRPVELVFRQQGELVVRIDASEIEAFGNGLIEYALVERTRSSVESGHAFGLPLELSEVPEGDYDVFVLVPGWSAWAQGSVRLQGGATSELLLAARPAQWARGRLLRADGTPCAGMRLVPDVPTWPPPLAQLWSTTCADDGSFELLLGSASSAGVRPSEEGRALEALPIGAGDGQTLVLR